MSSEVLKNWLDKPPSYSIGDLLEPRSEMPEYGNEKELWLILDIDKPGSTYRYVLLELYENKIVYWSVKFVDAFAVKVA